MSRRPGTSYMPPSAPPARHTRRKARCPIGTRSPPVPTTNVPHSPPKHLLTLPPPVDGPAPRGTIQQSIQPPEAPEPTSRRPGVLT